MESLLQFIKKVSGIRVDSATLNNYFKLEEATKSELLIKEGQLAKKMYFVKKGLLRTFYYDKNKEVTSWFYTEHQFASSWHSFYGQSVSFENVECIEDCKLYSITYDDYQQLLNQDSDFSIFGRKLAERFITSLDYFSKSYQFLSAREKYALILTSFPGIEQKVSLGMIASIMGVSRESVSRIRAGKL